MELEKTKLMNDLLDLYGALLTNNQLEIMEYYYMDDLSLSEIGENLNISRSAVHDAIKKSTNLLLSYEEKLKLLEKENKKINLINEANKLSKEDLIEELKKLWEESYGV